MPPLRCEQRAEHREGAGHGAAVEVKQVPWKTINGNRYYYVNVRAGGRRATRYVGPGERGWNAARAVASRRRRREMERRRDRAEREHAAEVERGLDAVTREAVDAGVAAIEAAGWHRHHRGEWRRRQKGGEVVSEVLQVQRGDPIMDRWAVMSLVKSAAHSEASETTRDALRTDIEVTARLLAGENPSPVEEMLATTAALAHFALRLAESQLASASPDRMTDGRLKYLLGRVNSAHRRLLSSLKTLEAVRRLASPGVQVNQVIGSQVNHLIGVTPAASPEG